MDITFDLAEFAAVDLGECRPGDLFWPTSLVVARQNALSVVAAFAGDPDSLAVVFLEGEQAFCGSRFRQSRQRNPVLKMPAAELRLQVDPSSGTVDHGSVGALLLTGNGPFVCVQVRQQVGFSEDMYLSLTDWTLNDYPGDVLGRFGSWKLSTRAVAGTPGTAIVSVEAAAA